MVVVSGPGVPQGSKALVGEGYVSALGECCYRITLMGLDSSFERASLCRSQDSDWVVVPPVSSPINGK
jgi:hypothetical protein